MRVNKNFATPKSDNPEYVFNVNVSKIREHFTNALQFMHNLSFYAFDSDDVFAMKMENLYNSLDDMETEFENAVKNKTVKFK